MKWKGKLRQNTGSDREEVLRRIAFEEPRPAVAPESGHSAGTGSHRVQAMAKAPAEGYATAQELADDLRRFITDEPVQARRLTRLRQAVKWARRHRRPLLGASVAAVLMVMLAVVAELILDGEVFSRFSADGRRLVTWSYHSTITTWEVSTANDFLHTLVQGSSAYGYNRDFRHWRLGRSRRRSRREYETFRPGPWWRRHQWRRGFWRSWGWNQRRPQLR